MKTIDGEYDTDDDDAAEDVIFSEGNADGEGVDGEGDANADDADDADTDESTGKCADDAAGEIDCMVGSAFESVEGEGGGDAD